MKTNTPKASWLRQWLSRAVSASALLLLGFAATGQVIPKSPLGTWDCVMSGPREGLAQITFSGDGTFVNNEILVLKAPHVSVPDLNQRGTGDTGRTPGTTSTNSPSPATPLFGFGQVGGPWGFDSRGRVIGYTYETDGTVTNALSFVATVVPGKRLTMVASTPVGKVTFRGVPDVVLTDLSGSWYGTKHVGSLWYTEFFTLTPSSFGPNIYDVQGGGPGYTYSAGMAMAVPQKKMAIALGIDPVGGDSTNSTIRAVVGPLNTRTFTGTLHGLEGDDTGNDQFFNFTAQRQ